MTHLRRTNLAPRAFLLAALLPVLFACAADAPTGPGVQPNDELLHADGTGEGWERYPCDCIQDLFVEIGGRVPGFGGFWLSSGGGSPVIVAVTELTLADTAVAETRPFFHDERNERLGIEPEFRVVQVDYAFADLARWSSDLTPLMWWPGVNGLSARPATNRIHMDVSDMDETRPRVEAWAEEHGVPAAAIEFKEVVYFAY